MIADRGGSTYVLPYHRLASHTCRAYSASAPSPCSLYGDASDTVAYRSHRGTGMDDALCSDPPRHHRPAGALHEGHRLASSDERTPARRPSWGSELTRVSTHREGDHRVRAYSAAPAAASTRATAPWARRVSTSGVCCVLAHISTPAKYATTVCAVVPGSRVGSALLAIASRQPRSIPHAHVVNMACSFCRTTGS
jgi:hypothetical protein